MLIPPQPMAPYACHAWRHPKPQGAVGRCIGHTDLSVDPRKAKRLAHRIRQAARRHGWPRVIHTSHLRRCACVGRLLKRWGWRHHVHEALAEMDFGRWEGRNWSAIAHDEVDAWCADFLHARPGGAESLLGLFERVLAWHITQHGGAQAASPCLVVAHAGWMQAHQWLTSQQPLPTEAAQWTRPPCYGEAWHLPMLDIASTKALFAQAVLAQAQRERDEQAHDAQRTAHQ